MRFIEEILLPDLSGFLCESKKSLDFRIVPTNGYYDNLIAQFEIGYQENFAKKDFKELYYVSKSTEDAIDYIKRYTPKQFPGKWF